MAGSNPFARISWRWEVGVWSDAYRHLLGPHLGTLLQEVKCTPTSTYTHMDLSQFERLCLILVKQSPTPGSAWILAQHKHSTANLNNYCKTNSKLFLCVYGPLNTHCWPAHMSLSQPPQQALRGVRTHQLFPQSQLQFRVFTLLSVVLFCLWAIKYPISDKQHSKILKCTPKPYGKT